MVFKIGKDGAGEEVEALRPWIFNQLVALQIQNVWLAVLAGQWSVEDGK
jgi:hypothetical protein